MPRLRGIRRSAIDADDLRLATLDLIIGPVEYDFDTLRAAWAVFGEQLTRQAIEANGTPSRPWAWWVLERGEQPPHASEGGSRDPEIELARLAELGELEPEEIERLRLRAADSRPLIDTAREHWFWSHPPKQDSVERRDVRLWEIVRERRRAR